MITHCQILPFGQLAGIQVLNGARICLHCLLLRQILSGFACGLHNSRQSKIITTKVHFCQKSSRIELRHDNEAAVRVMRFSTLGGNGLLVAFSTSSRMHNDMRRASLPPDIRQGYARTWGRSGTSGSRS